MLAGQVQVEIGGGQEYLGHARMVFRLMGAQPFQLGRGEARKHDIARQRAHAFHRVEPGGLLMRAAVVPQDAGADHPVLRVEQRRAMHVPGDADARELGEGGMRVAQLLDRAIERRDPVRRVLLAPARPGMRRRIGALGRADRTARLIDEKRAQPGGAEVDPEIAHDVVAPL
jgi:hypothetical protein